MVTSSAVVGSSAINRRGSQARAMAMTTRWRMPPESSWGYCAKRRSASWMRTRLSRAIAFSAASAASSPAVLADHLGDLLADGEHRVEAGHRFLEDHRDLVAAHLLQGFFRQLRQVAVGPVAAPEADGTGVDAPAVEVGEAKDGHRGHRFAAARFANDGDAFARRHRKGKVVDGCQLAALGLKADAQVLDAEQRTVGHGGFPRHTKGRPPARNSPAAPGT